MTKPVLLGKTGVLQPQMPGTRRPVSDLTMGGAALGPDHAFSCEMNDGTQGIFDLGVIRLWKVLGAAPWVQEVSSATVYPHGENPLGGSDSITFLHSVALDATRAVVLWKYGIHSNNGSTAWRHLASVVTRSGDTVSVGEPVEVLKPLVANAVGASYIGYGFDRWDGTTEGASHWEPSHTINGLVEVSDTGFVAFTTLSWTNPNTFTQDITVLAGRRFTVTGSTITPVDGEAGKWLHLWSNRDNAATKRLLYARDVARRSTGEYMVALGDYEQVVIRLIGIGADLPIVTAEANPASVVTIAGANDTNGRDRVARLARTPNDGFASVTVNEALAPNRILYVHVPPNNMAETQAFDTDLYSWGYWESMDAINGTTHSGQHLLWSVSGGLRVAAVGMAGMGGLEEADAAPIDLTGSPDYWNSHFVVMPGGRRAIMRLTDTWGEYHQYFLYDLGGVVRDFALRAGPNRLFFDRVV